MSSKKQWQDLTRNDRHHCHLCNAWMASDRQSISLHENGKKHRENVEKDLKRRRDEKERKEKSEKELEKIWRNVNAVAGGVGASSLGVQPPQPQPQQKQVKVKVEKPKAAISNEFEPKPAAVLKSSAIKIIDPDAGHYVQEGITYLEGATYASCLFEDNMPIQFWTGNPNATDDELRDLRNFNYWRTSLLAKVIRSTNNKSSEKHITCHVSYLDTSKEEVDEILEKNINPRLIRLILASDPSLPTTLEEARLALTGGEATIIDSTNIKEVAPQIDENTGLSTWSTTTIKKISTHYQSAHVEKKRKAREEKETQERNAIKDHEIRGRKMEEAKYENAHDSALGAYDVWNTTSGGKSTYKGVDITKEDGVEVMDTAKSLAKGGSVGFKKRKVVKKGVRRTGADEIE